MAFCSDSDSRRSFTNWSSAISIGGMLTPVVRIGFCASKKYIHPFKECRFPGIVFADPNGHVVVLKASGLLIAAKILKGSFAKFSYYSVQKLPVKAS